MNAPTLSPLGGPAPPEVPLPNAPLIKVLALLRFSSVLRIDTKEGVTAFQEAIRAEFPFFTPSVSQEFQLQLGTMPGLQQIRKSNFRFTSADKVWEVMLGTDFVSLQTEKYTDRSDFIGRLSQVITAVEEVFQPQIAVHLGIRFIDRLTGTALERIQDMINLNVAGIAALPIREHVTQALTQARVRIEEGEMVLRWGLLPPRGTPQPDTIKPVNEKSWILDIDCISKEQRKFACDEISDVFTRLAQRAYAVFRFMTTDEFLRYHGGKP